MALKQCRECKEMVSSNANKCPRCGVKAPTGPSVLQQILSLGFLGILVWGGINVFEAHQKDKAWLDAHPGQTPPDPSTGRPHLDHKKPWFALSGAPMCATKEDLAALRQNLAENKIGSLKEPKIVACFSLDVDSPVTEIDQDGTLQPDYLVRLTENPRRLVWIPYTGLRN